MHVSCGSDKGANQSADSTAADSQTIEENTNDYTSVSFNTPEDVRNFLNFKKFVNADSYIAFNGKGGVLDGEPFDTTDITVKDNKTAVIRISIPKMNMSGEYLLKVTDSEVMIEDEESHTVYKLSQDNR